MSGSGQEGPRLNRVRNPVKSGKQSRHGNKNLQRDLPKSSKLRKPAWSALAGQLVSVRSKQSDFVRVTGAWQGFSWD